jgi:hypothetical protein
MKKVIRCRLCLRLGNYINRVGKEIRVGDIKGQLLIMGTPEAIGQVDYLLVTVLEIGSPERCTRQDLQISLTVNPK